MGLAFVATSSLIGIEAKLVTVEVRVKRGLPSFNIVGLPDNAIKESRIRVNALLKHICGSKQLGSIVINLSPANAPKQGNNFDLPIALAILEASNFFDPHQLKDLLIVGELSLSGQLKKTSGFLASALLAKEKKFKGLLCSKEDLPLASYIKGIDIYFATCLQDIIEILQKKETLSLAPSVPKKLTVPNNYPDLSDVKGQEKAKRALIIAAAGKHHLLFMGPPGTGKTMLAKRLGGILPLLSEDQALEVLKIHSLDSNEEQVLQNIGQRPVREVHHTISAVGLIGGGSPPRAGEITKAHLGTLILDEFAEFSSYLLDLLRQPLEQGSVIITRAKWSLCFPCNFQLIATMNPCPCGNYGNLHKECQCSPAQIRRYQGKVSGPIRDRIDLQVALSNVKYKDIESAAPNLTTAQAKKNIQIALAKQKERFGANKEKFNADLNDKELIEYAPLASDQKKFMQLALEKWQFSSRAYNKIIKIALTIADLDNSPSIEVDHLAEALNFRLWDKRQDSDYIF